MNPRPRIVLKTGNFPAPSESFVLYHFVQTLRAGYQVELICNNVEAAERASNPELVREYKLFERSFRVQSPRNKWLRILGGYGRLLKPKNWVYALRILKLHGSLLPKHGYFLEFYRPFRSADVFHVHFADNMQTLMWLKQIGFIRVPTVLTFHGYDAFELIRSGNKSSKFRDLMAQVDRMTVNSEYLQKQLIALGIPASKLSVVPMGIHGAQYPEVRPKELSGPVRMVTIGRLIPLKGQQHGLQVLKILRDQGVDLEYTIIGEGPERSTLLSEASRLGIEPYVQLMGRLDHPQIIELLKDHQVFLMPSIPDPDSGRREAFGLVCLEAQAMGLPVVGFDSGGIRETLEEGKTGILVPEGDSAQLAHSVSELLADPDRYKTMSAAAIQRARTHFDIEGLNQRFQRIYDQILESNR